MNNRIDQWLTEVTPQQQYALLEDKSSNELFGDLAGRVIC